jgi:predicted ATPase
MSNAVNQSELSADRLLDEEPAGEATEAGITHISVKGLFGRYSYELSIAPDSNTGPSRLIILYGDNGSGKTTILRLIFHLLSPGASRGHCNELADAPYDEITVSLAHNLKVTATRATSPDLPPLTTTIAQDGHVLAATTYDRSDRVHATDTKLV